jgi:hypothetical protein
MKGGRFIHLLVLTFLTMSCTGSATPPEQHLTGAVQTGGVQDQKLLKTRPSGRETGDHVSEQVLVKFKEGAEEQTIEAVQAALHLQTIRIIPRPNLYLMEIQNGCSVEETIRRLQEFEAVEYAEPNLIRTIQ